MEKRSKGSNGVRDGSDWERKEKRREGVRWKKRTKGQVEMREGRVVTQGGILLCALALHYME